MLHFDVRFRGQVHFFRSRLKPHIDIEQLVFKAPQCFCLRFFYFCFRLTCVSVCVWVAGEWLCWRVCVLALLFLCLHTHRSSTFTKQELRGQVL